MLNIIKASAGSGKTYTLALEYIKLLLGSSSTQGEPRLYTGERHREYHRHIVAVTFSNKATDEMKQRIVKELAVLAQWQQAKGSYLHDLCSHFHASEQQVRDAARRALTELLFDYANFNVSTIDSFFQVILRTFAAEVELPYDYDIELNDDYALAVGVHDFLNLIRSDSSRYSQVLSWLKKYVDAQLAEGEGSWNPFKEGNRMATDSRRFGADKSLFSLAGIINTETFRKVHNEMNDFLDADRGSLMRFQLFLENRLQELLDSFHKTVKLANLKFAESGLEPYRSTRGSISAVLLRIAGHDYKPTAKDLSDLVKNADKSFVAVSKMPKKLKDSVLPVFDAEMRTLGNKLIECSMHYVLFSKIISNIYKLGLLAYINRCVTNFRNENNLILLSDTNALLSDIIGEDDTPFIYERIGTRVNNFLIDEFQDTSQLQWHNMEPMLRNSLADNQFNLIIGDEKQCIYRFRNSDPSLLQYKVGRDLKTWVTPQSDKNRNWRSSPMVVKFNNILFTHLAGQLCLSDVYANVVQLYKDGLNPSAGYVRINTYDDSKLDDDDISLRVIELICDMIDRGYSQSDIAILVDTNAQGATVIRNILNYDKRDDRRHRINVVSNESLLLCNSPAVRLVVSYLRYIALTLSMPADTDEASRIHSFNERLHRVLRQYERNLNAGTAPGNALNDCFASPDDIEAVGNDIARFLPRDSESFSLVSLVERIIERVSDVAKDKENAFLQAFQDVVTDFSSRSCGTLLSFLRWWDRSSSKLSIASPEGIDAVNVMTIHKSKGLEFGCVILPFASWKIGKLSDTIWFSHQELVESGVFGNCDSGLIPPLLPVPRFNELGLSPLCKPFNEQLKLAQLDSLNKTYVAFTRAVDELHIFTKAHSGNPGKSLTQGLDFYLSDFCNSCGKQQALQLNDSLNADVATWLSPCTDSVTSETYFEAGSIGKKTQEHSSHSQPLEHMQPYHVVNRHNLAKFKLPDVFYTPERELGILYHKIFSMIHSARDIDRVLRYCDSRFMLPADPTLHRATTEGIRAMLCQSDEVKSWFAPGNRVYNERTLLIGPDRLRPDRIITTPQGRTIIIDYKFGEPHRQSHSAQVRAYMKHLTDAGFTNVEGRIWYPFESLIVPV